jgi:uroporphyrin-3 C-methyltransferase/uroporphyrinogen III methyltransferase/synthase
LVSDFSATAIDLSTLIYKIAELPLKGDNARPSWENVQLEEGSEPATTAIEKSDQNNWLVWAKEIFGDVSRLVQIRRVDQTQLPKLESSQRFLAYENLRLQLLAGQLALLQRDQGVFEASIQQSRAWLIAYFEALDAAVVSFDRRLVEISEIQFAWEVPSISKTLDLMREEIKRREQRL